MLMIRERKRRREVEAPNSLKLVVNTTTDNTYTLDDFGIEL
jgi:hypothetical protein